MNNENEVMMEGTQYSTPQPPLLIRMFTILRSCNFFNFFRMGGGLVKIFWMRSPSGLSKNSATCLDGRNLINALVINMYPNCFFQYYSTLYCTIVFYIDNLHQQPIKQDKIVYFNHLFILVTWRYTRAAFKIVAFT